MAGPKSTQTKIVGIVTSTTHPYIYFYQYLLMLICSLSTLDLHVGDIAGCFYTPPKASIGMYSGYDYPYNSSLYTFWPCHNYFTLQFFSLFLYLY